ncbi:MAG TPA: non-ribosomal peptide synthetase, partial [Thermoanaerobaculia bacterium]
GHLASHLRALGVTRGDCLGVALGHSPAVVVALLGSLTAGAAYVPLDPAYPQERLAHMIEAAKVGLLVTSPVLAGRFAGLPVATALVDDGGAPLAERAADERTELPSAAAATADDLVYVIFTSGSTGRPKGVMLDHRGRVSNFCDFNRRYAIGPGDRVLALSSLSFDMSAYDILGTLAGGGAIVLPRPDEVREPAAWVALLTRHRVTVWHSVPALLTMLVEVLATRADAAPAALAALRVVLLGGDWIPVALPERLCALGSQARVVSLGGATEVSMDSILYEVAAVDPAWRSIPYGRPMANQTACVLSPGGEPAPVGVAGGLLLGGVGVGHGYFGRPDLTAERFVPDPHAALRGTPGARLYRTGDLARYGADGVIELLGRLDNQVKIRGYRIELAEIAAALRRHPAVGEAVVVAKDGPAGGKSLVAYCVTDGAGAAAAELRAHLEGVLPAFMVPHAIVLLAALPLTPNGKLDRRALPEPELRGSETSAPVPPRTALERMLAEIWSGVLGVPVAGVHDSFFDLGGHSLAATRVVAQIEELLPQEVPLRTLFEAPTVAGLAARLELAAGEQGVELATIADEVMALAALPEAEVSEEMQRGASAGEARP